MRDRWWILALVLILAFGRGFPADAAVSSGISYTEQSLGGGAYKYEYTVSNLSNPAVDGPANLYDFLITFDATYSASIVILPIDWDGIAGNGFASLFSLDPSADIAPGGELSGFVVEFPFRPGDLSFEATLTNPADPGQPFVVSGTTRLAGPPAPVPLPAALPLFAAGLAGLAAVGRCCRPRH